MKNRIHNGKPQLVTEHATLGALLEAALADLEKSLAAGIRIDMGFWVKFDPDDPEEPCTVCLAGAVMLQGFDGDWTVFKSGERTKFEHADGQVRESTLSRPSSMTAAGHCSAEARSQLYALNSLRRGFCFDAYRDFYGRTAPSPSPAWTALTNIDDAVWNAGRRAWDEWTELRPVDGGRKLTLGPSFRFYRDEVAPVLLKAGV